MSNGDENSLYGTIEVSHCFYYLTHYAREFQKIATFIQVKDKFKLIQTAINPDMLQNDTNRGWQFTVLAGLYLIYDMSSTLHRIWT